MQIKKHMGTLLLLVQVQALRRHWLSQHDCSCSSLQQKPQQKLLMGSLALLVALQVLHRLQEHRQTTSWVP